MVQSGFSREGEKKHLTGIYQIQVKCTTSILFVKQKMKTSEKLEVLFLTLLLRAEGRPKLWDEGYCFLD
jgi:hypothetical protein